MLSVVEKALRKLVKEQQGLNPSQVTELDGVPSSTDFARFVAANRPAVMRGAGRQLGVPALDRWTDDYLVEKLAERELEISATPHGNADAIVDGAFVEPANVKMPLSSLLDRLHEEEGDDEATSPVFYLQSQNGNLAGEYEPLRDDVGEGPAFAREVFGQAPDVANIWIGGRRSKTSLHNDPYENLYLVVRGSKTFTLFPPSEAYCMHEQPFPHATYVFDPATSTFSIRRTDPPLSLPWIPIDLDSPSLSQHPRFAHARPLRVTLEQGDMLYLPALWFHRVEQDVGHGPPRAGSGREGRGGERGVKAAIAVNWWTDMDYGAPVWSLQNMVRRLAMALDGQEDDEPESDDDEL
ncbi:hypothetical protein JCM9279_000631 [Rhodotorula babjevae]